MKIKERLTLIKWRIINSDNVRYFHLSKWPEIIHSGLIGAAITTLLFAIIVGAVAVCGLMPHPKGLFFGVLCTLSVGALCGISWRRL
jgi:O-antigen ligase